MLSTSSCCLPGLQLAPRRPSSRPAVCYSEQSALALGSTSEDDTQHVMHRLDYCFTVSSKLMCTQGRFQTVAAPEPLLDMHACDPYPHEDDTEQNAHLHLSVCKGFLDNLPTRPPASSSINVSVKCPSFCWKTKSRCMSAATHTHLKSVRLQQ